MNVFIACSANDNIDYEYFKLAKEVGEYYHNKGYKLVYGAYPHGMMKEIANIFGNDTIGVTVESYKDDLRNLTNKENYVEKNSFARLNKIYDLADIYLILPGGTGSLNELFGILEEKRCLNNNKRLILFNYSGFYDSLIKMLHDNKLIIEKDIKNIEIVNSIEEL